MADFYNPPIRIVIIFKMMGRIDSMSARLDDLEKSMLAMLENVEE